MIGTLRLCLALLCTVLSALSASAATPHTGFYTGTMYLAISGNVTMAERSIGPVGFNINEDGSVTSSGDLTGTVDSNGNITWVQPNGGNFQTGKVEAGVITSAGSVNNDGTISSFRVRASNTAPGFGGTSPLAGRIEQINPKQTLNNFTRIRFVNGRFMGVGTRGSIGFSDDGLNWTRFGVATTLPLYDIAYGNGMYVVVGDAGLVFTSPDAITWTARSTGTAAFNSVAFGNGKFIRSTFTGATQSSPDGITWQSTPPFVSGGFSAYGGLDFVNNLFVMYAGSAVVTSTDGATTNTVGSAVSGTTISISSAGRVVFGNGVWVTGGPTGVSYSTDLVNWTAGTGPTTRIDAIGFGNGIFVVQNSAKDFWTSTNGAQWKKVSRTIGGVGNIAYGQGRFIGVGSELLTSLDGEQWMRPDQDAAGKDITAVWSSVNRGITSTKWYIEGETTGSPVFPFGQRPGIRVSHTPTNGDIWQLWAGDHGYIYYISGNPSFYPETAGLGPKLTDKTLRAVAGEYYPWLTVAGDDGAMILVTVTNSTKAPVFELLPPVTGEDILAGARNVLVGTGGKILRSNDGRNWTNVNSGVTSTLRFVHHFWSDEEFSGELYIALGDDGVILTSADGAAWAKRESGTTKRLVGAAYSGALTPNTRLLIAAEDGTMLQSTNRGTNWFAHGPMPVAGKLTFLRNQERATFAGGLNGEIFTEFGALNTDTNRILYMQSRHLPGNIRAAALGNGRWVVAGDQISGASTDGKNWKFEYQNGFFTSLTFAEGKFVGLVGSGTIGVSTDGLYWRYQKIGTNINAIGYGGGRFVAGGALGEIKISDDAETWINKSTNGPNVAAIIYDTGKFTALGNNDKSAVSTDNGLTWSVQNSGGPVYSAIAYGNGRVATVNFDSRISTTSNFLNWQSKLMNAPTPAEGRPSFRSIMFFNGDFYASTFGGALYSSTNGFDWGILHTGLDLDIYAMAAGNGSMLIAGDHQIHMITVPDNGGPSVTSHPTDKSLLEDQTLTLTAGLNGSNLELVWFKDGQPLSNGGRISGANSPTLTVTGALPEDAGRYSLTASNPQGSRSTRDAVVTVTGKAVITLQPQSLVLIVGDNGVITVQATGAGMTYQWFKNGAAVFGANGTNVNITGATAASAGTYHVEVSNVAGTVSSVPVTVSVRSISAGLVLDTSWYNNPPEYGANPYIENMAIDPNGRLLIGGYFKIPRPAGGVLTNLARLNADGTLDATFNPPSPDSEVHSFHFFPNGQILISGYVGKMGNVSVPAVVRLNEDGSRDMTYTGLSGGAYTGVRQFLPRADGKIFGAGSFNTWGGFSSIKYFGLMDANGVPETSFTPPGFNNEISAAAMQPNGFVVVAGSFTTPTPRIGRLTATGQVDNNFFTAGIGNGTPYQFPRLQHIAIAPDGKIYVCGFFGTYSTQPAVGLARLNSNGLLDTTFSSGLTAAAFVGINDVEIIGDKLLVAGQFTNIRGQNKTNLVMLDSTGQLADGVNLAISPNVDVRHIIPAGNGAYYIIGSFTQVDGVPRKMMAKLSAGSATELPRQITSQPKPVNAEPGDTVTFSVAATGHGSLTFQWRKGDQNIVGQTGPSLTLQNVQQADLAAYSVIVTDANGSTTSDAAALTFGGSASGFATWATNLPSGQQGLLDDPDGDGLFNIAEYVFGSSATDANAGAKPKAMRTIIQDQSYAAVQFTRSTTATGATIDVDASLSVDFAAPAATVEAVEPLGNSVERVTIRAAQASATFFFKISIAVTQ